MPWYETEPMNEKIKFISLYLDKNYNSFQELCESFNISRKTGYKLVNRYNLSGLDGLKALSRAPKSHGMRIPSDIEQSILDVKQKYPRWGAKKVLNLLLQDFPDTHWPSRSTIEEVFKRHNLVRPAKRSRKTPVYNEPFTSCNQANDSWSIDYKGQFRMGNQQYCYPLTITDNFSRYILAIDGAPNISTERTRYVLESLFYEYGLPTSIRSDNGPPFASTALAGLSKLSVWLIKNGITPERIKPGCPYQNGRHERMHLELKEETTKPPKYNLSKQQTAFNEFKKMFNEQRPHEGIEFERPCKRYRASDKTYYGQPKEIEYDNSFIHKRKIRTNGTMKWSGKEVFVSEALHSETIAMKPHNEDEWLIYFSFMPIGIFNEKLQKVCKI